MRSWQTATTPLDDPYLPMPAIAEPSIKSLLLQTQYNGQPLGTGTGFVVMAPRGPVLLTNRHIVTGRHNTTGQPLSPTAGIPNELVILHNEKNALGRWIYKTEKLIHPDGTPCWIEHPSLGAQADFVALPLTDLGNVALFPYDPANPGPAIRCGPSDMVSVVGFPFGLTSGGALAIWATGFVASEPDFDFNGLPIFLVDSRTRPGQSGSAVIAYRSGGTAAMENGSTAVFTGPMIRFLGIYSGRINEQSDLGMVWKISAIAQLISSIT